MAAHVVTALNQIIEQKYPAGHIGGALNYSCWTEDLTLADYVQFDDIVNHTQMSNEAKDQCCRLLARQLLPYYTEIWNELNRPATREEWQLNKWGEK